MQIQINHFAAVCCWDVRCCSRPAELRQECGFIVLFQMADGPHFTLRRTGLSQYPQFKCSLARCEDFPACWTCSMKIYPRLILSLSPKSSAVDSDSPVKQTARGLRSRHSEMFSFGSHLISYIILANVIPSECLYCQISLHLLWHFWNKPRSGQASRLQVAGTDDGI